MHNPISVIILAAGQGKRMNSNLPKVMQKLAGITLIEHSLENLSFLKEKTHLVYGHQGELLKDYLQPLYPELLWVEQKEQKGTAHAVLQALPFIQDDEWVLITLGDMPLIQESTYLKLIETGKESDLTLLTACINQAQGYGRIIRNQHGIIEAIVEEKDANEEQKKIQEINSGVMLVRGTHLKRFLPQIKNHNAQGEYYLTDLIQLMAQAGLNLASLCLQGGDEIHGINNRQQLAQAEQILRQRRSKALLEQGVTLIDPERIDIQGFLGVGRDVTIEANVVFKGKNILHDGVHIESFCVIENSEIGSGSRILSHSRIEKSQVGAQVTVGPFARLRPATVLEDHSKVGNFVEIKASKIGEGSKINHLSYIGDALVGKAVNVGAGTITCNYDGANKHLTEIQDEVFIGSNSALVAPVCIEEGATIGAGSVVREDVAAHTLFLSVGKKVEKSTWQRPQTNKKDLQASASDTNKKDLQASPSDRKEAKKDNF